MFERLKQGAIYALIMAFLAQPVWAATETGVYVVGPDAWVNSGLVDATALESSSMASATATGAMIGFDYLIAGQNIAVNDVFGEIRAIAGHVSTETVFNSKSATATGIDTTIGVNGVLIRNLGDIIASADTTVPVPHDTSGGATAYGILTVETNDIENNGGIAVSAFGTSALAQGISASGDLSGTPTTILNDSAGVIDVTAIGASQNVYATGIAKTNSPGTITNNGQVLVDARLTSATSTAWLDAYGVKVTDAENAYVNTGVVDVFALNSGDGLLEAAGIYLASGTQTVINSGTINVEGISAGFSDVERSVTGIYSASSLLNGGDINVVSSGAGSTIGINGAGVELINTGTIDVSATNGLFSGSYEGAIGVKDLGGDFRNNGGNILVEDASIQAVATGVTGGMPMSFGNTGTIAVTAGDGGATTDSTADAVGVELTANDVENTGTISATANSDATATATAFLGGGWASFVNDGDIVARASATDASAVGVETTSSFVNNGRIIAESTGSAIGIKPGAGSFGGSITNTGDIDVVGPDATGIYLDTGDWQIVNSGAIQGYTASSFADESSWSTTNAFRALRVGVDSGSTATGTLFGDFQVLLDGDPDGATYLAPIFVAEGSTLNLNYQNLIATPGVNVTLNRGYKIIENEGTVTGEFGGLVAGNPAISTTWTGADNGENAEVTFGYTPEGGGDVDDGVISPTPSLVAVTMADTATDQLRQFAMGNALRGTEIAPDGPTAIVRPWAGNLNRSKKDGVGYNAGMAGVLAGVEVPVTADIVAGGHVVAGGANVDYTGTGYSSNSEDQSMFGVGAHGRYTPGDWYLDGMLTTYMVNHDYEGRTGLNLELGDDDEYESYGIEASLIGGHKFHYDNITAMPFAGLGYSWLNTPGHETETATGTWQTKYGTLDEHNVRAIIGARVSAEYVALDGTLTPSLGLRYEHSLTDNDIRIHQSLQGASANVEGERADGSVILDAGLVYGRGPLALEIGGSIEKNDDYDAQSGFIGVRWTF